MMKNKSLNLAKEQSMIAAMLKKSFITVVKYVRLVDSDRQGTAIHATW
ncbi:hypothetical protein COLO4_15053 [Corchorus olitorius]|uniref:Uncharacterized protein n=1 Tax=Corchorus olitorius TaxID=93759 RepID=A0A1R3JPT3_9ROSI|nr:hypothetical protein COLO4_15053 [Corchorus olitorius]